MKAKTLFSTLLLTLFVALPMSANSQSGATAPADTKATETKTEEPKKEKITAMPVSNQVAKLMTLYPDLVARISPYGKVCFDGGECDINIAVLAPAVDGQPRDGESIYNAICKTCHGTGLVGAPKFGVAGDWSPRIAKGKDTLYNNAINGIGAMPAKGGADIADEEVKNAVDYMLSKSS